MNYLMLSCLDNLQLRHDFFSRSSRIVSKYVSLLGSVPLSSISSALHYLSGVSYGAFATF